MATERRRPRHADPFLWDLVHARGIRNHEVLVRPFAKSIDPVAHGIKDFKPIVPRVMLEGGPPKHYFQALCGVTFDTYFDASVPTRHAAQFAIPCLRCWPDSGWSRNYTAKARKRYGCNH